MSNTFSEDLPGTDEKLGDYVRRMREVRRLSQDEVAKRAGIHPQSLGKVERGVTKRLNQKSLHSLALALGIPVEYLQGAAKGLPVMASQSLKFCPQCWQPGTTPDPMWTDVRSKFCFACGTPLRDRCSGCNEPIESLRFRFCPFCGTSYQG
ncbi:MAG TPA: zinc ribbon domain-containing protein [Leptolyngbyaceae cyanobacterium]